MVHFSKEFELEWNYNERYYIKGMMDGIGGIAKTAAFRKVKSNMCTINSLEEFAKRVGEYNTITSLFLPSEVETEPDDVVEVLATEGTLKVHKVVRDFINTEVFMFQMTRRNSPHSITGKQMRIH